MSTLKSEVVAEAEIDPPAREADAAGGGDGTCAAGWYCSWCKAVIEWPIALILLAVSAPVVVALAVLAKASSPGPAFYCQMRLGRNGVPFWMYKIRTMTHNCEVSTGATWAAPQDPRVTRLGQILRETHLDELPQLWHVLRGQMSLIGPRPERPELAARIEERFPQFRQRLQVRPGLTGLAQVNLPADTNLDGVGDKLAYDLYYIRHVSLLLDLRVSLCTALYLMGLCLTGMGRLLIKSYGNAVRGGGQFSAQPARAIRLTGKPDGRIGAA